MEEDDKGCPMIRMGVSGWVFLLVPDYPGCPGPKAVKRLCMYVYFSVCMMFCKECSPSRSFCNLDLSMLGVGRCCKRQTLFNAIKAKQSALNARKPVVGGREPHLCSLPSIPLYLYQSWYLTSSPQDPLLPAGLPIHLTPLLLRITLGLCWPLCAFCKSYLLTYLVLCICCQVKKGLEHLYRKVEKHLCEEENLLQVYLLLDPAFHIAHACYSNL